MKKVILAAKKNLAIDIEANKQRFISMFKTHIKREGADKLLDFLCKSDFFAAPSSAKYHMNVDGGLCQHTLNVIDNLFELLPDITSDAERETAFIAAALHDVCKINFYKAISKNTKIDGEWIPVKSFAIDEELPFGHGEKSVYIIQSFMNLTREEALAIRWHMGDFSEAYGSCGRAYSMCPLAVLLHIADLKASYLDEATYDYAKEEWQEE